MDGEPEAAAHHFRLEMKTVDLGADEHDKDDRNDDDDDEDILPEDAINILQPIVKLEYDEDEDEGSYEGMDDAADSRDSNDGSDAEQSIKRGRRTTNLKCPFCDHTSPSYFLLRKHKQTHHLPDRYKTYKCTYPTCDFFSLDKKILIGHLAKIHGETKDLRKCGQCDYVTVSHSHMSRHVKTHLPESEKPLKCHFGGCYYKTLRRECMNAHEAKKHGTEKHLKNCPHCDYVCDRTDVLNAHLASRHGETKNLKKCPHCDYASVRSTHLTRHMDVHLPQNLKQYKCHFAGCGYGTSVNQSLQSHLATHHGDKTNVKKCPLCAYTTVKASHVVRHMVIHVPKVKPFKCQVEGCSYSAKKPEHVSSHLEKKHKLKKSVLKIPTD